MDEKTEEVKNRIVFFGKNGKEPETTAEFLESSRKMREAYEKSIYYKYPYMKTGDIEKMLEERNKKT